jgi:hypothetical protein
MAEVWRCLLCQKDVVVSKGYINRKPFCDRCFTADHMKYKRDTTNIKIRRKDNENEWK